MMILIGIVAALMVISASIFCIVRALDSEAEFDDSQIDELCGHDWNPQEPNDNA